jgi:hypothetical protein
MKVQRQMRFWLFFGLIILVLAGGCAARPGEAADSFDQKFAALVKPYSFNFAAWEFKTLSHELSQAGKTAEKIGGSEADAVVRFFSTNPSVQDLVLKDEVQKIIARQISQVLDDEGINNPFVTGRFTFPPVNFRLENPPNILVVSPREKVERMRDVTLKQEISINQMDKLESEVEQLNVSALVIPIGGLGAAYPIFVMKNSDLKYTIDTVAEEWLHQYLAFKPLGFRYVLDLLRIKPDPDIDSINETVAGIASQEIGDRVYAKYYYRYPLKPEKPLNPGEFDFNAAMRETRLIVDAYLVSGQIEPAENYMEERRRFINAHGYNIRKLNQAYFAFYGSYAYSPTSVDPLGDQVRLLRKQSPSLKDFLLTASGLSNRKELSDILTGGR